MSSKSKFEDLNLSSDEVKRLSEALKKEEFRKLFVEYAEEISDPENRRRYEEEISMLENERGMDVKFIHPEPGFVLKTSINGTTKAFINVCKNENVAKPTSKAAVGKQGLHWSIPHSFSPPREDIDKQAKKCQIIDFVVHPDTYLLSEKNDRFRKMLYDIIFEGIDKQFDMQVDRKNIKHPNIKYKGTPVASVVRNRLDSGEPKQSNSESDDFMSNLPIPNDGLTSAELTKQNEEKIQKQKYERENKSAKSKNLKKEEQEPESQFTEPNYIIKYRTNIDMANYTNAPDAIGDTRPSELVVEIELPLLKSASSVNLDIYERKLKLETNKHAQYKLDLNLSYPVDENVGGAKFDKTKRKLIVTLPVLPPEKPELPVVNSDRMSAAIPTDERCDEVIEGRDNTSDGEVPEILSKLENEDNQIKKPLIEVLADDINDDNDVTPTITASNPPVLETNETQDEDKCIFSENDDSISKKQILYTLPAHFDCTQNDETVSFVLDLQNVSRDTMSKTFCTRQNGCQVKMVSLGSGGFPMHYSFFVQFPDDCLLEPENCYVSLSDVNVVITLVKIDSCVGMWNSYKVGVDEQHLQERLFLTENNLCKQLDDLDQEEQGMPVADQLAHSTELEVTELSSRRLTLQIPACSIAESGLSPGTADSSDSIEVIYEKKLPKLQGILKQRSRTQSESSDDVFSSSLNSCANSNGADTPITEESESESHGRTRSKSVSFSEHIDKTTFKKNQSVSSMTPALKSKRRRNRKREEKQVRRQRRSSGSFSEQSSADEQGYNNCTFERSDSTDSCENSNVEKEEVDEVVKIEEVERTNGSKRGKKKRNRKGKGGPKPAPADSVEFKDETCKQVSKRTIEELGKHESENKNRSKTEDSVNENGTSGDRDKKEEKVDEGLDNRTGFVGNGDGVKSETSDLDEDDDDANGEGCMNGDEIQDVEAPLEKDGAAKSEKSSMLSWDDAPVIQPKCGVVLNNSVMFDLDID